MEERLSPFFEQLDGVYRQGFPEAVEAFLRESLCRAEAETDRELELAVRNELGSFFRGANPLIPGFPVRRDKPVVA